VPVELTVRANTKPNVAPPATSDVRTTTTGSALIARRRMSAQYDPWPQSRYPVVKKIHPATGATAIPTKTSANVRFARAVRAAAAMNGQNMPNDSIPNGTTVRNGMTSGSSLVVSVDQ
jgi:hypothetical protein